MKLVFIGEKKLFKKKEVQQIHVPLYDEVSVKSLWPELQKDEAFMKYFPNAFPANKGPARQYFMDILNTIYPEYMQQILQHAAKQRHTVQDEDRRMEAIKISEEWLAELNSMPFTSCKFYCAMNCDS